MKPFVITICAALFLCACGGNNDNKTTAETKPKDSNTVKPPVTSRVAENPYVIVDVSPMDMSYFPVNYLKDKMAKPDMPRPLARVIYSRPHLQGRHVFHEVLKYGTAWRLGANESTELELYSSAVIQGKKIKAGRYVLYCIPQENEWTIVLNSHVDSWGLKQEPSKDITTFKVPVIKTSNTLEYYTMVFLGKDRQAELLMAWDNVEVRLPLTF